MKTILMIAIGILTLIICCILIYIVFAYVTLQPNPLKWTEGGRFIFILFEIVFGIFFAIAIPSIVSMYSPFQELADYLSKKDKKEDTDKDK